jgi:hypothetical protein
MSHDLAEKLGQHPRRLIECSDEDRAKVCSRARKVPLTHEWGVCGSGNRSHSHPARVPARCADKRALSTQGHFGSCVPLQLPAELPFLQ